MSSPTGEMCDCGEPLSKHHFHIPFGKKVLGTPDTMEECPPDKFCTRCDASDCPAFAWKPTADAVAWRNYSE